MARRAAAAATLCAGAAAAAPRAFTTVELKNAAQPGMTMPMMGLGTAGYSQQDPAGCTAYPETWNDAVCPGVSKKAVQDWIAAGGARIDHANNYYLGSGPREGIAASGVARKDLFITTKIAVGSDLRNHTFPSGYNETQQQAEWVLEELGTSYVDLLLIHWPFGMPGSTDPACQGSENTKACRLSTWRGMLALLASGKARAVGVSNWNVTQLQDVVDAGLALPAVNQCPYNPHLGRLQAELLSFCQLHGIHFQGYSPLGVPDTPVVKPECMPPYGNGTTANCHRFPPPMTASLLDEPAVRAAAAAHRRSAAEVVLAWEMAKGVSANPRTRDAAHMRENLRAAADPPPLTAAETAAIDSMAQSDCDTDPSWYECAGTNGCFPGGCPLSPSGIPY